jgi:hypothetical protein
VTGVVSRRLLDTGPGSSPGQALFRRYDEGGIFILRNDQKRTAGRVRSEFPGFTALPGR